MEKREKEKKYFQNFLVFSSQKCRLEVFENKKIFELLPISFLLSLREELFDTLCHEVTLFLYVQDVLEQKRGSITNLRT